MRVVVSAGVLCDVESPRPTSASSAGTSVARLHSGAIAGVKKRVEPGAKERSEAAPPCASPGATNRGRRCDTCAGGTAAPSDALLKDGASRGGSSGSRAPCRAVPQDRARASPVGAAMIAPVGGAALIAALI